MICWLVSMLTKAKCRVCGKHATKKRPGHNSMTCDEHEPYLYGYAYGGTRKNGVMVYEKVENQYYTVTDDCGNEHSLTVDQYNSIGM